MKNKKGFTLIELLAVIVILGLLMAIAIPSVTKYITQSRKKTLTSTIGNYIGALVNDVNDLTYTFTEANTIYAVPIECIALERGGTNPFGVWYQASNAYWAYVLVQYDDETSSYTYGYTFKDSAGYGLYPTSQVKLNEQGKQIQTGLSLTRPQTGKVTSIASVDKWTGFDVDSTTNLVVLVAESEGNVGNGETTCTLQQKGNNYATAEEEKNNNANNEAYEKYLNETTAYALYSSNNKTLTFVRSKDEIKVGDNYDGINVTNVYTGFETSAYKNEDDIPWTNIKYSTTKVVVKDKIRPISTKNWFLNFENCAYFDVANLDTSRVENMSFMFSTTGLSSSSYSIVGLEKWDTSNVTNMANMFEAIGTGATHFFINGIDVWDTSKVTNMSFMFGLAGGSAETFVLDLRKWDTSNVTDMSGMFNSAGYGNNVLSLNLSGWNTSNVTNMFGMFSECGFNAEMVTITGLNGWDVSNVEFIDYMFSGAGHERAESFTLNLSNWNLKNATELSAMFYETGYNAKNFSINLTNWNTSNVINMSELFSNAGAESTTFKLTGIENWNTSNVENMYSMFSNTGSKATYTLNLRNWNVSNVVDYAGFNENVTSKVLAPTWVN